MEAQNIVGLGNMGYTGYHLQTQIALNDEKDRIKNVLKVAGSALAISAVAIALAAAAVLTGIAFTATAIGTAVFVGTTVALAVGATALLVLLGAGIAFGVNASRRDAFERKVNAEKKDQEQIRNELNQAFSCDSEEI